ncbi:hypothetical protein MAR_033318, partial [Mya arenaria]
MSRKMIKNVEAFVKIKEKTAESAKEARESTDAQTLKYVGKMELLETDEHRTFGPQTLKYVGEMEVLGTDGHREFGYTTVMAVVGDRFLVAVDSKKECLRCFDMDSGKQKVKWYESNFLLWDVTAIPGNRVAVSSANEIWFLRVTEKGDLLFENKINVKKRCYGIASSGDNLIVCYQYPDSGVQILDMKGNMIKEFKNDGAGKKLFELPTSVAVSPDHITIYIVDEAKNTVISLTQDGHVLGVVMENLLCGTGITVDSAGRLYVCGYGTVLLVFPETRNVIPLLEIKDVVTNLTCVAICD